MARSIDELIDHVVDNDLCSGCGACAALDDGLDMAVDDAGYLRPTRRADSTRSADPALARRFRQVCPALSQPASRPQGTRRHPTLGSYLQVWSAWATDPAIRRAGSSGGVLTALSTWLVETGLASSAVVSRAAANPRRTEAVDLPDPVRIVDGAGSRYAPVAVAAQPAAWRSDTAVVGKPCEAAALRAGHASSQNATPVLLSFFCAGTPSQHATERVIGSLGIAEGTALTDLRYRGDGWPGRFTAVTTAGDERSASYAESWGDHLGKAIQWRCKICPDGVGESADIVACDWWEADERGFPQFAEGDGRSGLIARTARGLDIIERAVADGVLLTEPLDPDALMGVQPFQRDRRETLLGRLLGSRLAGRTTPAYRGYGLLGMALRRPRDTVRAARGTWRRIRRGRTLTISTPQEPSS